MSVYPHTQARRIASILNKKLCSGRGREKLAKGRGVVKATESEGEKRRDINSESWKSRTSIQRAGRAEKPLDKVELYKQPPDFYLLMLASPHPKRRLKLHEILSQK